MRLIERAFGSMPSQPKPPAVVTVEPAQRGERRVEVVFDAEPVLVMGYHKPAIGHPDDFVFDALDAILSEGQTSRLYSALVREKRVASAVGTDTSFPGVKAPGLFVINAAPRAPHTVREVEEAIDAEIERLKAESVAPRELEKVLNNIDAELVRGLRSNSGLASQLAYFQTVAKDWRYILRARDRVAAVTAADIRRVAAQYLVPANRTVAWVAKPPAAATASAPAVSAVPAASGAEAR
jgi:predicted Zn-dependent peptidase